VLRKSRSKLKIRLGIKIFSRPRKKAALRCLYYCVELELVN